MGNPLLQADHNAALPRLLPASAIDRIELHGAGSLNAVVYLPTAPDPFAALVLLRFGEIPVPNPLGVEWGVDVDLKTELVTVLASGNGLWGVLENALFGQQNRPANAERTLRRLYTDAEAIGRDVAQTVSQAGYLRAVAKLPDENRARRFWEGAGFMPDQRGSRFFRSTHGSG